MKKYFDRNFILGLMFCFIIALLLGAAYKSLMLDSSNNCSQPVNFMAQVKCANSLYLITNGIGEYDPDYGIHIDGVHIKDGCINITGTYQKNGVALAYTDITDALGKAVPAVAGNIAKLSIDGHIFDGGTWSSQFTAKELLALAAINAATAGAMLYHDGTGWAVLPIAPDTYVLKSNGTIPVWTAP